MPVLRTLCVLLAGLLLGGGGQAEPAKPATQPEDPGPRVVVHVGRNHDVRGYVKHEDDDFIIVRTVNSAIESFSKARVLKIVRLVDPAPGQRGVVYLRDGQVREGVILEDGFDQVLMEIKGVRSALLRDTVDHVRLLPTFDQQYALYKASVHTPNDKLRLCYWLVKERRYELAREELTPLLGESSVPDALRLLKLVEAQLALEGLETPADADEQGPTEDDTKNSRLPTLPVLSREDVNLIRVFEIDFDRPPRVSIEPDTIRKMIRDYGTNREIPASEMERRALYRADPLTIVELLFKLRAQELYPRVKVLTEPWTLNLFRRRVHNAWLLNSCATAHCHGGPDGGQFFLHRRHYKDERVRYANLLILERLEVDPDWPLINYDDPMMSLLVQYGLPVNEARKPHPDVKGWKPVFGRSGKRMLRDTLAWIDSMMQPRPDYPVEYDPPRPVTVEPPSSMTDEPEPDREPR